MPLITLLNETKLKSLGFGNDRPDGASSNQPYIQTPIPEERETNSPDFLLRNGNSNLQNSENDVSRLTKYLTDDKSPEGLLFVAKQQLLERQNVDVVDDINRIYNPIGTIAQAGIVSLGGHLNKQGFIFTRQGYYNSGRDGYYYSTIAANNVDEDRLSLLFKAKKVPDDPSNLTTAVGEKIYNITPSSDIVNLISYPGGPGSTLGIGKTNIRIQNSTRTTVDVKEDQKFQPSFYSTVLNDSKYLVINNGLRPSINWLYNPRIENPGVSNAAISEFDLEEDQTDFYPNNNVSLILDRNESVSRSNTSATSLNPNIKATKSNTGDPNKEFTVKRPFINWTYNPRIENPGVSNAFISEFDLEENQTPFYPDDSADSLLNRKDLPASPINSANNTYLFNYSQSFSQESKHTNQSTRLIGIKDFRKTINEYEGEEVLPSTDYSKFNREDTYKDSKTTYKGNYKIDAGNGKRIFDPNEWISEDQKEVGVLGEDIIDFNFSVLSNTIGSGTLQLIDFRAYIENWNDDLKAEWNSVKYMGRAENFYKYSGFSRDISITFLVPALSRGDMLSNYKKLNALAGTVAPSYSPNSADIPGVMRGSITKFTMGNYFRGMPSIIKGVQFSEIENMGWDINRDIDGNIIPLITEDPSSDGFTKLFTGQLPKGIKVTVNLTPLHNFVPQYGEPFIGDYSNTNPKLENIYTY
jgi:hypothetical protein